MKILFRADSSSKIGLGHIMRDVVLAEQFGEDDVIFACRDLEGHLMDRIPYPIMIVKSEEIDELIEIVQDTQVDMLVIDHYGITYADEKRIKDATGVKIFVLDDTYERHHCDILLNHNISADKERYKSLVPKGCEIRCGEAYTLLRREFREEKSKGRQNHHDKRRIFVAMGGADSAQLNVKILHALESFSNLQIDVVTTSANPQLTALSAYVANRTDITLHLDTDKMAVLMNQADFAIVTPSVTVNEVLFLGVPFVAIMIADNQVEIYRYLKASCYAVMDPFDGVRLKEMIEDMDVVLLDFVDLNDEEKKRVLLWRNSEGVCRWMLQQDAISLETHLRFIERLKKREDRCYFLVKSGDAYIGVIDFTQITKESAHFGIYANPNLRGMGDRLMRQVLRYACCKLRVKKLFAEVFCDNEKAIKLYNRHQFCIIEDGNLIKMERSCENW